MFQALLQLAYMVSAALVQDLGTTAAVRTNVCELRANSSAFSGQVVSIDATYRSDRRHFSLLTDKSCGPVRNTIEVGTNNSPSATSLWSRWEHECQKRGEGYCVVEAEVRVTGAVRRTGDGLFFDVSAMELHSSRGPAGEA